MIARVAVMLPVAQPFDYLVPAPLMAQVHPGVRVWAPWGTRAIEGVVVGIDPPDSPADLKSLARLVDAPALPVELVELASWVAEYYMAPPGEVMRLLLPAGGRAGGRRVATLSAEGLALAGALDAALEPAGLRDLGPAERAIMLALKQGARDPAAPGQPRAQVQALAALVAAGLVEISHQVRTRGGRAESWLTVLRAPVADELARAARRLEVFRRVEAAGELALEALTREDPQAAAHARALVKAGLLACERRQVQRDPFAGAAVDDKAPPEPNVAQVSALVRIEEALAIGVYAPFLLHGVTGSGKTEVYLRAIKAALASGRSALVLVPEIALTPQLAARFRARFGDQVAVLHSALSDADRADAWRRIRRGEAAIALGARSAVFAPLPKLGVVVVDEEHDPSFKQQEGVRYHGRDVALVRARAAGAVVLLGSATPSVESWQAAQDGRFSLLSLPERATARPLPSVEILDLRQHKVLAAAPLGARAGEADGLRSALVSAPLAEAIARALDAREQVLLFLNRRGLPPTFVLCRSCGNKAGCAHCAVTLTWHRAADQLVCHYCGHREAAPRVCAACGSKSLERLGFGTEQVEAVVRERFPAAKVARLDRDTAAGSGLTRILDGVRNGAIDILVGTQMITKGHDFPNVTLVGVVLADHGMGLPDFRADERTFQLLEQVAGRAGRGEQPGRVLLQTYSPEHPAVTCARDHAYHRFVEHELAMRKEGCYPPFSRLACVLVDGADPVEVKSAAEACAVAVRAALGRAPAELAASLLGPAEAPLSRLKGRTRWQLFIKAATARGLRALCRAALAAPHGGQVRLSTDIDPTSML